MYISINVAMAAESCPFEEQHSNENNYKNVADTSITINVNELQSVIEEKSKSEPNAFYKEYKVEFTKEYLVPFGKKKNLKNRND